MHLLHIIAHAQGPAIRATCSTLRDAYGPLDIALDLTHPSHITSQYGTQHLITNLFHRNPHITALALPPLHLYPNLPAAAAARFPSLHTLTWSTYTPPTNPTVAQLAPLHSTLTALHIHPLSCSIIAPQPAPPCSGPPTALATLTALRSLTLPCHLLPPNPTSAHLAAHAFTPLAALPHLDSLALLPTHPRPAIDDPLPNLAAATPHLTSLSVPAWTLSGPSAAAVLAPSAPTWPQLTRLHLNFQHPPPTNPGALAHCADALASIAAREPLHDSVAATVHLSALAGVGDKSCWLGWLEAAVALQVCELEVAFEERHLLEHATAAACLWGWLQSQASLRKLAIGRSDGSGAPPGQDAPARRQPLDASSPYAAVASLGAYLEDLSLGLHWAQGYSHFVTDGLALLTRLTRLAIADAPTPRWDDGVDDFEHWGVDSVAGLRELRIVNLPAPAVTYATALPALAALTVVDHQAPEPHGESPCWDLSCLANLAGSLTRLTLQGLPRLQCPGLAVLCTLGALRELHLTAVDCLTVQVAPGARERYAARLLCCLLPLPPQLRALVVEEGTLHLSAAQVRQLLQAAGPECRVRVDHMCVGGCEMSLDTRYGIGPVWLGPQWSVTRPT